MNLDIRCECSYFVLPMSDAPLSPNIETAEAQYARYAALLGELQTLGMRVARATARQAEAAAEAGELDSGAAALALGRAGKMVRQCIALEQDLRRGLDEAARGAGERPASRRIVGGAQPGRGAQVLATDLVSVWPRRGAWRGGEGDRGRGAHE